MKKLLTILAFILFSVSMWAQGAPQKMSYQAIIRNSSNVLIVSTQVGMQISILQGTAPVYVETQTPTTNINGLATIEVGAGTVVSGTFSTIDWANGPFYIKTETDPAGGTSYSITGMSQLLSVPYALYAATVTTSANLTGMVTSVGNATTVVTNANLTGDVTSTGNATTVGRINGTSLAGLTTGILKNTTTTGVPSIAVAVDFPTLNQSTTGNAATVTTNANLTGEVTSVGNAATVPNATVIGKVLTGYTSGAGTIAATDNILQAIQKLDGNNTTNANLTGPITSVGNATSVASQTGTGSTFVMNTSPILVTPNIGTPSAGVATNLTGTAAGLTSGNVTTNANLTGEVTSVGNAATVPNATVIGKVLTGYTSGAGTIAATDNILQAIQKLDGNNATNVGTNWALLGNAGTVDGTNFIGTTDNVPLTFKVNNQKAGRIDNTLSNTFFGYLAGNANTTGSNNTANGAHALYSNTTGYSNTASGFEALRSNTTGYSNTASGDRALFSNTTGYSNTASGFEALNSNTTASNNVAIGDNALRTQSFSNSGTAWNSFNTAIGNYALFSNQPTTINNGINNTALGHRALFSNTSGHSNTASGFEALNSNTTGYENTASGMYALRSNTTGYSNTASGDRALFSNTIGNYNTVYGGYALVSNISGNDNTASGFMALRFNTTGNQNTANGFEALISNTTGIGNTANGWQALYSNTTGIGNTAIGYNANVSTGALTNATAIGSGATVNTSNTIQLGNTSVTDVKTSGTLTAGAVTYLNTDGTSGQVLTTNGAGATSWTTVTAPIGGFTHYLGEDFNGGIIYYLYKGSDGLEHGLIVSKTESTAVWQATPTLTNADRTEDGVYNTGLMTNSAAATYIGTLGAGWYLPSIDELALLYNNRYSAQKGLRSGSFTLLLTAGGGYWSSTEYSGSESFSFYFGFATQVSSKNTSQTVRGIRAF